MEMTRAALIEHCLSFGFAYEDYPFDGSTGAGVWTVMRHRINRKGFAFIFERGGRLCVNLKCEPGEAELLRRAFAGVTAAYHMNKRHWNTVEVNADVPRGELFRQIERSYALICPKRAGRSPAVNVQ